MAIYRKNTNELKRQLQTLMFLAGNCLSSVQRILQLVKNRGKCKHKEKEKITKAHNHNFTIASKHR